MLELSSPTRDRTHVSCIARRILNHWTPREVPHVLLLPQNPTIQLTHPGSSCLAIARTWISISSSPICFSTPAAWLSSPNMPQNLFKLSSSRVIPFCVYILDVKCGRPVVQIWPQCCSLLLPTSEIASFQVPVILSPKPLLSPSGQLHVCFLLP